MESTLAQLGEDRAIALIAETLAHLPLPPDWVGIGDDAAVTTIGAGQKAVTTTDILVEDVHFRRRTTSPRELGWKAMAVNISDVASMGALPRWSTVSLALPGDCPVAWLREFYVGVAECAASVGLAVVGGDTTGSPGPMMIAVTVVGEAAQPLLRTGACAGDVLAVTGTVGDAAAGFWLLEHAGEGSLAEADRAELIRAQRAPRPHVAEGRVLAESGLRLSVLDNSDGLGRSALVLAQANGMTVELDAERVPLSGALRRLAEETGNDPMAWGLWGGEEYNLVLSVEPGGVEQLRQALAAIGGALHVVGRLVAGPPEAVLIRDGLRESLRKASAFQHFAKP